MGNGRFSRNNNICRNVSRDFRNCEKVIICLHQFQAKNVASDVSWIIKFAKTIQLLIVRILIIDVLITIKNGPSDIQTANTAEDQNNL